MYEGMPINDICCIDMRSFYASISAADLGLNVMDVALGVVGDLDRSGSVILAASPLLKKKFGVKSMMRRFEVPDHPEIILVEPKMQFFVNVSMQITKLINEYIPKEDIFTYSIDEIFFDLKGTERLWGPIEQTIQRIQDDLLSMFQLPSAVGMGPNILMSKLALDLEAKKTGFAKWTFEDVPTKLWPVSPLSEMWGIGSRTEKTLHSMGIYSVGDLANTPLEIIEDKFGKALGNQLFYHAWGVDLSVIGSTPASDGQVSYGKGQMLMKDYNTPEDVLTVVLEMCEDVGKRARDAEKAGRTIQFGIAYSKNSFGGGFQRSRTIPYPTNDTMKIYKVCKELFYENYDERPVRHVSVSISNLEDEKSMQLSLFENNWRQHKLAKTMDSIRNRYGSTALLRAVSLTEAGTALQRASLVGGHKK